MLYHSMAQMVGNTPLLEASRFAAHAGAGARLLCKLESFNPAGSAKDRVALAMIESAAAAGKLPEGGTIIEPTSGNTGIGLAAVAIPRGYRVILTMPDTMSAERRQLLAAYGAEIVLTEGKKGMQGAIDRAAELASTIKGSFIPSQFDNPDNPAAHYGSTGPEIWQDTAGKVDVLVAGVGTGGTLTGTSEFLREHNPALRVVAVEPANSPLLSGGTAGPHGLQGIGANFIPANLKKELIDDIVAVTEEEAFATARAFARCEGLLVGISSGAALHAAALEAAKPENRDKTVVAILPDTGDRYLSTPLFKA